MLGTSMNIGREIKIWLILAKITATFFFIVIRGRSIYPRYTAAYGFILRHYPPSTPVILDVSTSAGRHLHLHTTRDILAAKGWTVAKNVSQQFCLNAALHITFRDLPHAVNLRHGTDGFTSPPKEGVLRILSPWKILTASAGFEPGNFRSATFREDLSTY
jgi:hypothetical protein